MAGPASNTKVVGFAGHLVTAAMGAAGFITPARLFSMRKAGFLIRKALEYDQQIHKHALIRTPKAKHRPLPAKPITYHCESLAWQHSGACKPRGLHSVFVQRFPRRTSTSLLRPPHPSCGAVCCEPKPRL
ncbi:MAG: hypothetical protein M2R45_02334 [Verrucomicrobia subdivision 3 bacterium]|nr:hypothetical protein [Limisphaerales bacterium]MCS1414886.1 hypothetical protein [Limisphaerales bacterium]